LRTGFWAGLYRLGYSPPIPSSVASVWVSGGSNYVPETDKGGARRNDLVERVDFLGHKMPFQKGATRLGPKPKSLPLAEGTVQRGGREKNASSPARLLACVPGRPSTTSRVRSCATVSISSISTTTSITTTPTLPSQHPTIIPLRHLAPSLPPLLPPPSLPPSLSPPRPTLFATLFPPPPRQLLSPPAFSLPPLP
jgi:hypothetical protein